MSDTAGGHDLSGAVALVTGGSRGLGWEIALGLAGAGAAVIVASRKADACRRAAAQITQRTGSKALAVGCHLGRWSDVDRLVDSAYDWQGHVDILVNNAGMSPIYPEPAAISEELFDKVVAVNLKGAFRLTALIGTRMASGSGGSIINISSVESQSPSAAAIPYAAAKAGLNAMALGFTAALSPLVRVNTILPGGFRTDIAAAWNEDMLHAAAERPALRRIGEPSEIVGAALYFASSASSYTTGAMLHVDGGLR